jgi:hypothetical protein
MSDGAICDAELLRSNALTVHKTFSRALMFLRRNSTADPWECRHPLGMLTVWNSDHEALTLAPFLWHHCAVLVIEDRVDVKPAPPKRSRFWDCFVWRYVLKRDHFGRES